MKKSQEIEFIYLVDVCRIIYTVSQCINLLANQYVKRYFRCEYVQKPPSDFKTLYCSWQIYSSDKHLKRTEKTDLIMF